MEIVLEHRYELRQEDPIDNLHAVHMGMFSATSESMQIVQSYQRRGSAVVNQLRDKDDRSVVTAVDHESETAAKTLLSRRFPHIPILGEEQGLTAQLESDYLFMVDPIDGTRPFLIEAPTSTVIAALYNNVARRFEAVCIGEPATGRFWFADGKQTRRYLINTSGLGFSHPDECHVWGGSIENNASVLIENFAPFSKTSPLSRDPNYREKRQMLTGENVVRLITEMNIGKVAIQNYGSNGLHHALVANGGNTLAGSITTSMGGEWDTAGALAVINAGGVAEGYRMTASRRLEERDPLDPFDYDMLITANNGESLQFLRNSLRTAVHEN